MTTRREFLVLGLAVIAAPNTSLAQQQGNVRRIGFLGPTSAAGVAARLDGLRAGLRENGYVEGKNLAIEFRWADGDYNRLPELASELVRLKVEVIVTHGAPGARAAKEATATIPIVFAPVGDAVAAGLVANLARPGGNITGSAFFTPELNAKRLELLKEVFPRIRRVAFLFNSNNPGAPLRAIEAAAGSLKVELQQSGIRSPRDFESAFEEMSRQRVQAVAIVDDPMLIANADRAVKLAAKHGLPSIGFVEVAESGGLMAYGVNLPEMARSAATLVAKILKGAKPGDLPVERATKFELVINMKTAKALGLAIPPSVLVRADRVIE